MIGKQTGVPVGTVKRWIHHIQSCAEDGPEALSSFLSGPNHRTHGNPRAHRVEAPLTPHDKDQIIQRFRTEPTRSLRQHEHDRAPSASRSTLQRLRARSNLHPYRRPKKPATTPAVRKRRVIFAKSHLDDECALFCCADEVKAKSDGSVNHHNSIFYAESPDQVPPLPTHKFPLAQDYFCAITINGGLPPVPFSGHLTAVSYQRLLDVALHSVNAKFAHAEWIFVHDSAPYHAAESTQSYLESHVPSFSPNTNGHPIHPT